MTLVHTTSLKSLERILKEGLKTPKESGANCRVPACSDLIYFQWFDLEKFSKKRYVPILEDWPYSYNLNYALVIKEGYIKEHADQFEERALSGIIKDEEFQDFLKRNNIKYSKEKSEYKGDWWMHQVVSYQTVPVSAFETVVVRVPSTKELVSKMLPEGLCVYAQER